MSSPLSIVANSAFNHNETHGISLQKHSQVHKTSDVANWSFAHLSYQTEKPYQQSYKGSAHALLGFNLRKPTKVGLKSNATLHSGKFPPGAFTLIPQNVPFEVTIDSECDSLLLYLHDRLFIEIGHGLTKSGNGAFELGVQFCISDTFVESAARTLLSISNETSPQHILLAEQICRTIALYVTGNYSTRRLEHIRFNTTDFSLRLLSRIEGYILAHLSEPISLEQLAEISELPLIRFQRAFKASTGLTPYQYVLKMRVEHARKLLDDPKASLARIAVDSGFANQTHLTRLFKQFYGKTPGDWRKR